MKLFVRKVALATTLAFATSLTPALAGGNGFGDDKEKGFYLTAGAGIGQMTDIDIDSSLGGGEFEFDSGFSGDIGVGYDFGKVRAEVNYNSLNTDLDSIQGTSVSNVGVDVTSWFVSAAYDFRADKKWQPYVSLGLGSSEVEVEAAATVGSVAVVVSDDDIQSFLGKVGVNYDVSERFDIYGEAWLQAYDDFKLGTLDFKDCSSSGVSIGTRIKF